MEPSNSFSTPGWASLTHPLITLGVRVSTWPVESMITRRIFTHDTWYQVFRAVKRHPTRGLRELVLSNGLSLSVFSFTRSHMQQLLVRQTTWQDHVICHCSTFTAAGISALATAPLDTIRLQQQVRTAPSPSLQIARQLGLRGLYKGLFPVLAKNSASFGLGITCGERLSRQLPEEVQDSATARVASRIVGWSLGCLIGAPFYTVQGFIRTHESLYTTRDVVRYLQIRSLLQIGRLWRGFAISLPLTFIGGLAVSIAEEWTSSHRKSEGK